jgi:hypothetical protein
VEAGADILMSKITRPALKALKYKADTLALNPLFFRIEAVNRTIKPADDFFMTVVFPDEGAPARNMLFFKFKSTGTCFLSVF